MSVAGLDRPGGENKFGRTSELRLVAVRRGEKTVLEDIFATMPFHVMHPFEVPTAGLTCAPAGSPVGEGAAKAVGGAGVADGVAFPGGPIALALNAAQVMVMSASAGIMAGDAQRIVVSVGEGAALQVTTQAFDKVHRMGEGESASRSTSLRVADGGYLDYSPQPTIPFSDSAYAATTAVELEGPDARFVYEEVLSCGRAARGERFGYRSFRNHVRVDDAGAPVYVDNTIYEPGLMPMGEFGFYEGFSHLGNLVLVNCRVGEAAFAAARDYLREETGVIGAAAGSPVGAATGSEAVAGGVTRLVSGDVCVRLLGHRAQRVSDVLGRVRSLLSEAC